MGDEIEKIENKSDNRAKNGGARPGAGRPKGKVSELTKLKQDTEVEYKKRVAENAQRLLDAQLSLAKGNSFLFRIDIEETPRGGKKERKAELVTSEQEIKDYLDGKFDDEQDKYYYITTSSPDNKAIDSMLDRTYGKAAQSIDLTGTVELGEGFRETLVELKELIENGNNKENDSDPVQGQ